MAKSKNPTLMDLVHPLSAFSIIEPGVLKKNDSEELFTLNKGSESAVYGAYWMGGRQFVKKLHQVDENTFHHLVKRKSNDAEVKKSIDIHKVILSNGKIMSVCDGIPHLEEFDKAIKDLSEKYKMEVFISDDGYALNYIITCEDHYGIMIRLYLQTNWVVVNECRYNAASQEFNIVTSECISLSLVEQTLTFDDLEYYLLNHDSLKLIFEDQSKRFLNTHASVDEYCKYFKSRFGIKSLTMEKPDDIRDLMKDEVVERMSEVTLRELQRIVDQFYNHKCNLSLVHPYLIKATTFTPTLFSDLIMIDQLILFTSPDKINVSSGDLALTYRTRVVKNQTNEQEVNMKG